MESQNLLQSISEVAVTLAGFSGVVAVLGHRDRGSWSAAELLQLRTLVEPSLIALFGSLFPGTLQLADVPDAWCWRIANAVLGVLGTLGLAAFILRSRAVRTTPGQRVLLVLTVPAIGANLLTSAGVLEQQELFFVVSLLLALAIAAYNFLLLLFSIGGAD
jgi:hypothetical protein